MTTRLLILTIACAIGVNIPFVPTVAAERQAVRIGVTFPGTIYFMRLYGEYSGIHPDRVRNVRPCPSFSVVRHLVGGKWEVAIHSGPLSQEELESLEEAFPEADEFPQINLGSYAVAVVADESIPVTSLTTGQLGGILLGEITNWEDVGGPQREITVVGQTLRTNSGYILQMKCFPNQPITKDLVEEARQAGVVAKVKDTRGAIGFFLHEWDEIEGVRVMKIAPGGRDGKVTGPAVIANDESMAMETYPLIDTLIAVLHPEAPPESQDFLEFARTEKAGEIGRERRIFTAWHRDQLFAKKRLADHRAGKGTKVVVTGPQGGAKLAEELAKLYVERQEVIQVKYSARREAAESVAALASGEAELLFVDGDGGEFAQLSKYKPHTLGRRAVGVIVHPDIRIDNLLVSDLKRIYEGEVTEWDDGAEAMKMYGPDSAGPAVEVFAQAIAAGRRRIPYVSQRTLEETINTVAADPASIGLVDLSEFSNQKLPADDAPTADIPVKLVPIVTLEQFKKHGSRPLDPQAIPKDYPLSRTYTLYVSPEASETTKQFVQFLTPAKVKETLASHGLIAP